MNLVRGNCDWNLEEKKELKQKPIKQYGSAEWQFCSEQSDEYEEYDAKTAPKVQVCVKKKYSEKNNESKQEISSAAVENWI